MPCGAPEIMDIYRKLADEHHRRVEEMVERWELTREQREEYEKECARYKVERKDVGRS